MHGARPGPAPAKDHALQRARRRWFERNHPVLATRMLGVGDAYGVDPEDDRWDLGMLGTYEVPAGCSAVFRPGATTKDGHALLARNFDFPTATFSEITGQPPLADEAPLARDVWVVELHPDEGFSSVVVGIMDVLGGMDGINSAGLSVALLADDESPHSEPSGRPQVGLSEQQVVRYLLDTCADVDEAVEALYLAKQYYLFVRCHFLVADASGRAIVWEHSPGHNIEHVVAPPTDAEGRLVCTNHLLHRWPQPDLLPDDERSGIAGRTYARWRALDSHPASTAVADPDSLREQLADVAFTAPVVGTRTLWTSVYDLEDRSVELSFYRHDHGGTSRYTQPLGISLR